MSRIHIILDEHEKERFREQAAREGKSLPKEHRGVIERSIRSGLADA